MNKYYEAIINTSGDAKALSRVQVLNSAGDIVTIYADKSGTRFTDATGTNVNYCEADATGMVEFYWTAASNQTLQVLDSTGELERSIADFANNFSEPEVTANVDAVIGVPAADGNLGTFTGSIIPDSSAVKTALQALETASDNLKPFTDLPTFKAQPVTNANSTLITAIGGVNYSWLTGDYSAITPDDDVYIKSDDEALTVGVWVKQTAQVVTDKAPFTNSVIRVISDRSSESRSVLEWFTDAERAAARAGDLSVNHTAAIQRAFSSGVPVIDMHDYLYRIDTTVNIPTTGIKVTGNGWRAERGVGFVNNNGKMFYGLNPTGPIEFENGTITGNITEGTYGNQAAGVFVDNSSAGVVLRNFSSNNFALGSYMNYVDGYSVIGGSYKNNVLMGMSGKAKNILCDGVLFEDNGHDAAGQTHDFYYLNADGGIVRNTTFKNHRDPISAALMVRWDLDAEIEGFDEVANWETHNNTFIGVGGNGARFGGWNYAPEVLKPLRNIKVYNNDFGGNELWFDDVISSSSWENENIGRYHNRLYSKYPGYPEAHKLTSTNDACEYVAQGVQLGTYTAANDAVIFDSTKITGNPAFRSSTSGGIHKCTLRNPKIQLGNDAFDTSGSGSFLLSYRAGRVDVEAATGPMARLNKNKVSWVTLNNTDVYDFDAEVLVATNSPHQLILNAGGASSITTMTGVDGQIAEFYFRTQGAAGASFTFPANVGLSTATASDLATGPAAGRRLSLTLVYSDAKWREKSSSGWVA